MTRVRCDNLPLLILVFIGVGLLSPGAGWAHPGQHIGLRISIGDEEVANEISISADFLRRLIPAEYGEFKLELQGNDFRFLDSAQEKGMRQSVADAFKDGNPVTIDGVEVRPILKRFAFVPAANLAGLVDPLAPPDAIVVLAYPAKGRPKQVSIVWELYPAGPTPGVAAGSPSTTVILAELDAYTERQIVMFTPEEPEIIWHLPTGPVAQRVRPVVVEAEPARISLPLLSLGIVVLWTVSLVVLRSVRVWRRGRRSALALSLIPIAIAVYCHDVLAVSVVAPWEESAGLPGQQEATDIFTALHRNVYRAFDYKTESDIYDVLAQSVSGDLLDQVYNEVYQSLIMRDQGGAVARVHSVDVLNTEMVSSGRLPETGHAAFGMRSRWQVYGVVSHWGHFHARTNEYEALYTIAQLGQEWKITGVEVLQQRRIVSDDDDPIAEESQP